MSETLIQINYISHNLILNNFNISNINVRNNLKRLPTAFILSLQTNTNLLLALLIQIHSKLPIITFSKTKSK